MKCRWQLGGFSECVYVKCFIQYLAQSRHSRSCLLSPSAAAVEFEETEKSGKATPGTLGDVSPRASCHFPLSWVAFLPSIILYLVVLYVFVFPTGRGILVIPQIFIEHEFCASLSARSWHDKHERYVSLASKTLQCGGTRSQ